MPDFPPTVVSSLRNALGVPSTRIPIDLSTFVLYVLPPLVCYFVIAALAVTPHTYTIRVGLWPLAALLAWRAMSSVGGNAENDTLDTMLVPILMSFLCRSIGWIIEKEPLMRHIRPRNSSPSTILDALDLVTNPRGHGWAWSRRLYVPHETRPANRSGFVFHTFLSAVAHALICGVCHRALFPLLPEGVGRHPKGSTFFDESLAYPVRYLRASVMTTLTAFATYGGIQVAYDLCTLVGILFLGQDTVQWPPLFDAPWRATSLTGFWGRRWHQFLRQVFLLFGGYPLSLLLGRAGIVIGAFLVSALWHHMTLRTFDSQADIWWNLVGFGMMAPGVLAEQAFHRWTGKRVDGVVGWIWTVAWLTLWGNVIFEGFARAPLYNRSTLIDNVPLLPQWVDRLVIRFDQLLHAI